MMINNNSVQIEVEEQPNGDRSVQIRIPDLRKKTRADKFLAEVFPELSRSQFAKLFEQGSIWSEETALSKSDSIRGDQELSFIIPRAKPLDLEPKNIPLDIIFEDEDIVVINKRAGMIVHPGAGTKDTTLVHALLYHCSGQLSGIGGVERPGIVHRLDKETSGLIVCAKSDSGFKGMVPQFAERKLEKYYQALILGNANLPCSIEEPIGRHPIHRTRMSIRKDGRYAKTDFKLIKKFEGYSQIEAQIFTGRTHQIRVHAQFMNSPLLGDVNYGFKPKNFGLNIPRIMLHASRLIFNHPVSGEMLELEAELPDDFRALI